MSELGLPKTLQEALTYIIWGVLILGFGLEFCTAAVHEELWRALFSFAAMGALAAVALYSRNVKIWLSKTNPNYVLPTFMLLFLSIILSPFIEERRWPFASWWLAPSADEIAEAVARKLPKTSAADISAMETQLDSTKRELTNAQEQITSLQPLHKILGHLIRPFGELRSYRDELRVQATQMAKADQVNKPPLIYIVPPCHVIVSFTENNKDFVSIHFGYRQSFRL